MADNINASADADALELKLDSADGVVIFSTVEDMVAATDLVLGQTVKFNEYATLRGGESGNIGVVVNAGTGTADGGEYIDLTASSLQWKAFTVENVKQYNAAGDGIEDDTIPCQRAIDYGAGHFPSGTYKTTDTLRMSSDGDEVTGEGYGSVIKLTGAFASNTAALLVPANGDIFGSTSDGGNYTRTHNIRFDGSAATAAGGRVYGYVNNFGIGHGNGIMWSHGFDKSCVATLSTGSNESGVIYDAVIAWGGTGTGSQGYSHAITNDDEKRVVVKVLFSYDHSPSGTGIGFDMSTGSGTLGVVRTWNCGAGGGKNAANDATQRVIIHDMESRDHTNAGAQGYYTNGSAELIYFKKLRVKNTAAQNLQIAHDCKFHVDHAELEDAGSIAVHLSANYPEFTFGTLDIINPADQGVFHSVGDVIGDHIRTKSCGDEGYKSFSVGIHKIDSIISTDDCDAAAQINAISIRPASDPKLVDIASVYASDANTNVTNAISINANVTDAALGSIKKSGNVTNEILDGGVNTSYLKAGTISKPVVGRPVVTFTNADATPSVQGNEVFRTNGLTAITDFDDGVVGQTIRIIATNNITITNSAIIQLSGGVNHNMTLDDTLTLTMFTDQIWTEIARSIN